MNVLALCLFLITCRIIGEPGVIHPGIAWILAFSADVFLVAVWSQRGKVVK